MQALRPQQPEVKELPATCPFCGSAKIMTASAKVDASSYWRCEVCGELWNPGRFRAPSRDRYQRW